MGYAFAISPCVGCGQLFTYNPVRVPSITIKPERGREPICEGCVARVNPMRKKNGLPLIEPLPGAYAECDESELGEA